MESNSYQRHLLHLALLWGGSIAGAVLAFILQVYIGRNLGPNDYGTYANALAQVTLLSQFAGFGLQTFWIRVFGSEGWQAQRWIEPTKRLLWITSTATFLLFLIWVYLGANDAHTRFTLLLMSPAILGFAAIELVASKFQLEHRFETLSIWSVTHNLARLVLVVAVFSVCTVADKLYLTCVAYSLVALVLACYASKQVHIMGTNRFKLSGHGSPPAGAIETLKPNTVEAFKGSWVYGLDAILFLAYFQCSNIILKYMTDDFLAGQYFAAFTIMNAVYLLPTVLYTKFLLSRTHRWAQHDKPKLLRSLKLGSMAMLGLGIIGAIFIWLVVPHFWKHIYGVEYDQALNVLFMLAFCAPIKFLSTSIGSILTTGPYINARVLIKGGGLLICVAANMALIPKLGATGAALATVVTEFVILVLFAEAIRRNYSRLFKVA